MDRELEYKLEAVDRRLKVRKAILSNYRNALIDGIEDYQLEKQTINWVKRIQEEIRKFESDRQNIIKRYEKSG